MFQTTLRFSLLLLLLTGGLSTALSAADAESTESFRQARNAEKAQDYSDAVKAYKAAGIYADDPVLKSNALLGEARASRKRESFGDEFDCLQTLVKEHIGRINYAQVVDRQYAIADAYFAGHRDSVVSWLPFLKKEDRSIEMYEAALKNGPCSGRAPDARLRLARLYLNDGRNDDAVREFRETVKLYPETDAARYAFLELSNAYLQLARRGDGDGSWAKQAIVCFDEFLAKYPRDPESGWVRRSREEVMSLLAKRLYGMGAYYHRMGKDEIAERYLARVVRDYANSDDSLESEKLLAKIDKTYTPPDGSVPRKTREVPVFTRGPIPREAAPVMVVPENSDGKWLLPVRDLKGSVRGKYGKDDQAERKTVGEDDI